MIESLLERAQELPLYGRLVALGTRVDAWLAQHLPAWYPQSRVGWARLAQLLGRPTRHAAIDPEPLLEQLQASDWQVRRASALHLASQWSRQPDDAQPELVEALAAALRDPAAEVAEAACQALGHARNERANSALREVLANGDGFFSALTRAAALRALAGGLRGAQLNVVFGALRDVQAEVSLAAIEAILAHAREAAVYHLLPVLQNEDGFFTHDVRRAALAALRAAGDVSRSVRSQLERYERDLSA